MADRFFASVRELQSVGYGEHKSLAIVRGRWRAARRREPVRCPACGGRGLVPGSDPEWPEKLLYGPCGECGGEGAIR